MADLKLFMVLLGCRVKGRHTEQHDIFFGIGESIKDIIPDINSFWPEARGRLHIDAWREVTNVNNYNLRVIKQESIDELPNQNQQKLFFLNLGGYKKNEFEEYHYKMLAVSTCIADAAKQAKQTTFYKHTGFDSAPSHIDDKYGVDVDDVYEVKDILPIGIKEKYSIKIALAESDKEDEMHLGYFKLDSF